MTAAARRIAEVITGKPVTARGGNYLVRCPAHDDSTPSLSLRDGTSGLLVHCFSGCPPGEVFAAIRRIDRGLLQPGQTAREPAKGSSEYERRQHDKAAWLWSQRRPITDSPAEGYLHGRGITFALPPTLAFLPPRKPEQHPAMISAFGLCDEPEPGLLAPPRNVQSVHLTLLKPDGTGKADVERPKLIIGSPGGSPIVIAPPNDLLGLAITEGIEDALALHQALGLGAWAAGAASFLPKLAPIVPDYIEAVTIELHPDGGRRHAEDLASLLRRRHIEVFTREATS